MDDLKLELLKNLGQDRLQLGGKFSTLYTKDEIEAEYLYIAETTDELVKALELAIKLEVPFLVLGSGTHFKPKNDKITGLVIKNKSKNIKLAAFKGKLEKSQIGIEQVLIEIDSG